MLASGNTERAQAKPRHDPLLTVAVNFDNITEAVQALIDSGASLPVMSSALAEKLGWQDKKCPTQMAQAEGTPLEARRMVNAQFMVAAEMTTTKAGKRFGVNAEVLDLGDR